jgi:hypothetical protein
MYVLYYFLYLYFEQYMSHTIHKDLPVIGKDLPYSKIDQVILRVHNFRKLALYKNGRIEAISPQLPYGYLEVEVRDFDNVATLPILNKNDYIHIWQVFEERGVKKNEEVNVIWTSKNYRNIIFSLLSPFMPKLIIWICNKNAFELMHEPSYMPKLSGEARFDAEKPIIEIKHSVMD